MRILILATAALLLVVPAPATAQVAFPTLVDAELGNLVSSLNVANSTYGPRGEFDAARVEATRAALALVSNATLLGLDSLVKAAGALETGRARAQAAGMADPSAAAARRAEEMFADAVATLSGVRDDLKTMERAGLEPVALDGGILVGYITIRGVDLLDLYRRAAGVAGSQGMTEAQERTLLSAAAGAQLLGRVARSTLENVTLARGDAPVEPFLSWTHLQDVVFRRTQLIEGHPSIPNQATADKAVGLARNGESLMALAGYALWVQDVVFAGRSIEVQSGADLGAILNETWELHNQTAPRIQEWRQDLGVPIELSSAALGSARLTLALQSTGTTDGGSLALATSYVHLGIEQVSLLLEAYRGIDLGAGEDELPRASSGPAAVAGIPTWAWLAGGLLVVAIGAAVWRRRRS